MYKSFHHDEKDAMLEYVQVLGRPVPPVVRGAQLRAAWIITPRTVVRNHGFQRFLSPIPPYFRYVAISYIILWMEILLVRLNIGSFCHIEVRLIKAWMEINVVRM